MVRRVCAAAAALFAFAACTQLPACSTCKCEGDVCMDCTGTTQAAPAEDAGTPNGLDATLDAQEISPTGESAWGDGGIDVASSSSSGGADATDGYPTVSDSSGGDAIGIGDTDGAGLERSLNDASSNCPAARPLQRDPCDFSMRYAVCLYSYAAVCPVSRCECYPAADLATFWLCDGGCD